MNFYKRYNMFENSSSNALIAEFPLERKEENMSEDKYYSSKKIRSKNCVYNIIFGERSNGKTFDILREAFKDYISSGEKNQLAIIRRWDEDFTGANSARTAYNSLMCDGAGINQIEKISKGKYTGVEYYAGKYYLTVYSVDLDRNIRTDKVIAYAFALTQSEHYKSGSFPNIKTVLFDEFLTRKYYLPDEFILFQNVLSTIIRDRNDVKIYMCGNTVNKYSPYFSEMGLTKVKEMEKGSIDVYTYADSRLTVAVEYCGTITKKKSDVYFAFDNPRLSMITTGTWEIDIYPHLPKKYKETDRIFTFYICFDGYILENEIIKDGRSCYIYTHRKTTPLKHPDADLIYSTEPSHKYNYRRNFLKPITPIEKKIYMLYTTDKIFYQDNEIGEIMRNFIIWCRKTAV